VRLEAEINLRTPRLTSDGWGRYVNITSEMNNLLTKEGIWIT